MITRPMEIVTAEGVSAASVIGIIEEFRRERLPDLKRAKAYYDGKHAIMDRKRAIGTPNNRVAAPSPRYIATIASGYLMGSPAKYQDDAQEAALETLREAYAAANSDNVDAELALQAAVYGVGVEIAFFDRNAAPKFAALDPRAACAVYDDTVEHKPIMGLCWRDKLDARGERAGVTCEAYTADTVQTFEGKGLSSLEQTRLLPNMIGAAPITEYWNNADERGDFDCVISLIDAYDTLMSDRVNDKEQFANAYLVFTGVGSLSGDGGGDQDAIARLREDRVMFLPDRDATAQWLAQTMNEADVQTLADAIRSDIHKFSMTPDLSDANFSGNASGVAMRYKLFAFEQLTKVKERWFMEGLRSRLRVFASMMARMGLPTLDAERVSIQLTRSLPVNELETAQMVSTLRGLAPDEMLLAQLPFVSDAASAMAMLRAQREEDARRTERAFMAYPEA